MSINVKTGPYTVATLIARNDSDFYNTQDLSLSKAEKKHLVFARPLPVSGSVAEALSDLSRQIHNIRAAKPGQDVVLGIFEKSGEYYPVLFAADDLYLNNGQKLQDFQGISIGEHEGVLVLIEDSDEDSVAKKLKAGLHALGALGLGIAAVKATAVPPAAVALGGAAAQQGHAAWKTFERFKRDAQPPGLQLLEPKAPGMKYFDTLNKEENYNVLFSRNASDTAPTPTTPSALTSAAELEEAVKQAKDPVRARAALNYLRTKLSHVASERLRDVEALLISAGSTKGTPGTEGLVAPVHAARALEALAAASPETLAQLEKLLEATQSPLERGVLLKAIGGRAETLENPSTLKDLAWAAGQIRGHNLAWLVRHTTPYAMADSDVVEMSVPEACAADVTLAGWAEADVVKALRMRQSRWREYYHVISNEVAELKHASGVDDILAAVGTALWERFRGSDGLTGGAVVPLLQTMNEPGKAVGATYTEFSWLSQKEPRVTLDQVEEAVRDGYDVYVRIVRIAQGRKSLTAHLVLLVDCYTGPTQERRWLLHDPSKGSFEVTDEDFSGYWNGERATFVSDLYLPHPETMEGED